MISYIGTTILKYVVYEEVRRFAIKSGKEYVKSKCLKSLSYYSAKNNLRYYTGYEL